MHTVAIGYNLVSDVAQEKNDTDNGSQCLQPLKYRTSLFNLQETETETSCASMFYNLYLSQHIMFVCYNITIGNQQTLLTKVT
jgi:hypothetical protein